MSATWMDTTWGLGQAGRLRSARALASRPGTDFIETRAGKVRVRRAPSPHGPRLVFLTDGPNVIEHYDALLAALHDRADVLVVEPPGTGASAPAAGFTFTIDAFAEAIEDVLRGQEPRTLVAPCYLGLIAQRLVARGHAPVARLVLPQTPSWEDMGRWANRVDPRRLVRTPILGQGFVALSRRRLARGWYGASLGQRERRPAFVAAAEEAFAFGGCFCLASLMQGLEQGPPVEPRALSVRAAVVWGDRDRTHARVDPSTAVPGAEVVRFDTAGHAPELEEPARFADWIVGWHAEGAR